MRPSPKSLAIACISGLVVACSSAAPSAPARAPRTQSRPPAAIASTHAEILPASASAVGFARMAKFPEPGWQVPRHLAASPDGKLVTFLESEAGSEEMALFALDVATGKIATLLRAGDLSPPKAPSLAEELRRERQRQRITGITDYAWAEEANVMVLPAAGDVFVRTEAGVVTRLTDTPEPEIDPRICARGTRVAYARGSELYVYDLAKKKESALTTGAKPGVTRGQSDFNGQEELDEPSGFVWSRDCAHVAYWEVDESAVKELPVLGYRKGGAELMMQRYPLAGGVNPKVKLFVADVATKKSKELVLPGAGERYFGRIRFSDDGASLLLQSMPRSQRSLEIVRFDVAKGEGRVLHEERWTGWTEMTDMAFARRGKELLVVGENGGHLHLERLDASTGASLGFLTSGDWDVTRLVRYDEASDSAYVIGTLGEPLGRQLFAVPLAGGAPRRITEGHGVHDVSLPEKGGLFIDVSSALDAPPKAEVRAIGGGRAIPIPVAVDPDVAALRLRTPDSFEVPLADGPTLYGQILAPRDLDPTKRYPLVVMVYGGPGVQTVLDRWSPRLLWQHLADRGFFVMQVDNRGSSGRGPAFAAPIRGRLGQVELADQLAALDHVLAKYPIDPKRVGIYGHSYGGTMAALAMLAAPGRFAAGVSASPVTDFRLYDSGYTERYMGLPQEEGAAYDGTDLTKLAPKLEGHLFLLHALMDENVHFDNAAKLIDALVAAQKPFDLMVFPGERHGYRAPAAKEYALRRVTDYLVATLAPPP